VTFINHHQLVTPAKAGVHGWDMSGVAMESRFRGNDGKETKTASSACLAMPVAIDTFARMIEQPLSAGAATISPTISPGMSTAGYESDAEAATVALAARIAGVAEAGDVIALDGPLGAGKTVFARGFIRALTRPDEEVPSPTFTLVQVYEGRDCPIHHFDLYRIETSDELYELGIEEAFTDGITLIEWPDRARAFESERWLTVVFAIDQTEPEKRTIALRPGAAWAARLETLDLAALGLAADDARHD
jgi:tRNA threonylcarbamoyladenosine biosynthesis protein TsaE